ncbi:hypothetical protein [Nocardia sp. CS682]|uniref:phage upper tail fiber protein n=1 Tax=Nocardia sp. CS682 TaxID=1047172 RepID=UPI001074C25E|nr:hypothetical protein [Nocardia sp. CS682]QBS43875.1 hypothetical protein DMB37_31035 [Nocardia sp. CS682]
MTQPVRYVKVVGNFGGFILDGLDPDDKPDEISLKGSVRFSLLLDERDAVLMPNHPGGSTLRVIDTFDCELDADGDISHRGKKYVMLPALDIWTNPKAGRYRVDFIGMTINGRRINLRPLEIPAVADTVVDLAREFPVPGTPSPGTTRGEDGMSVIAVRRDGSSLVFTRNTQPTPSDLPPVPLPEVDSLASWRDQAHVSAANAATSAVDARTWAEAASAVVLPNGSVTLVKLAAGVQTSLGLADSASQPGHTHAIADVTGLGPALAGKEPAGAAAGAAASAISTLRDGVSAGLNTLSKLAGAIGNSPTFAADTATAISARYTRPAPGIPTADIADGAVNSAKIADGAVSGAKIADGAITSSKFLDGAIALVKLAVGRVTGSDKNGARSLTVWVGTEADFQAIPTKDGNTLYLRTA